MRRHAAGLITLAALAAGCAPPAPHYDDAIGLEGVPIEPGALAGVFAHKVFAATLVQVPIPGIEDELGGGFQWLLLERIYDEDDSVYRQRSALCGGMNVEVHGTAADAPESTYRAVPASEAEVVSAVHDTGAYEASGLLQLWGLKDLDDPAHAPLPADAAEAASPAFAPHIYDLDADGKPGYTTFVTGLANGEAYAVLRRKTAYRGVSLGNDRVVGLAATSYESTLLGASSPTVEAVMGSQAPPYPDPGESWFDEVRIADTSTCDDVLQLDEAGGLARRRPF
jgi:hypothetical protein